MATKPIKWLYCKRRGKNLKLTLCAKMLKCSSVKFSVGIVTLAAMFRFTASFFALAMRAFVTATKCQDLINPNWIPGAKVNRAIQATVYRDTGSGAALSLSAQQLHCLWKERAVLRHAERDRDMQIGHVSSSGISMILSLLSNRLFHPYSVNVRMLINFVSVIQNCVLV